VPVIKRNRGRKGAGKAGQKRNAKPELKHKFNGSTRPSKTVVGVFSANSRGYGFVVVEKEGEPDIFIPADKVNGALHSDTVECTLKLRNDSTRPEGAVTGILSRGFPLLAGTFCAEKKGGYLTALEAKIPYVFTLAPIAVKRLGLVDGHRVMFRVQLDGRVQVEEILGHKNDPGVDVLSLVRQHGVPHVFSDEALQEAAALPYSVTEAELEGRVDYRDWPIITIDGSDTKDIDDAISLRRLEDDGNFELGVHIADVSHYVQHASALDLDARNRGTSIYLADRVIPMLPHKLSNGICSLNPHEDRLALSCIMEIDCQGDVVAHRIEQTVIHSQRRFTYDEVADVLEDGRVDQCPWSQCLIDMNTLAETLRKKRMARGALDFNFSEAKVIVNESGFPTAIEVRQANAATSLIEEFMLVCNETVAERCKDEPFVFRTHEGPDTDKMYKLSAYAQNLGYNLPVSERGPSAKALQKLLLDIEGTPEEAALGPVILRSLKQARYTPENTGHFGLASKYYCHFTSPIRRYPDLLVHRAIKGGLKKRNLSDLCAHCSETERNAEALEREVMQLKKCQFMADKIGQDFEGTVSGVVSWGVYVQLPDTIEGLIPLEFLADDEYVFVEKQMAFFGVRKKKRIRLGDPFKVVLSRVDVEERRITFAPSS